MPYELPVIPSNFGWGGVGFGEDLRALLDLIVGNGADHESRLGTVELAIDALDPEALEGIEGLDERLDAVEGDLNDEGGIVDRVEALETTVDTETTGLTDRVEALETTVDTADTGLTDRVEDLETAVGGEGSGLVKDVADLTEDLGTLEETVEGIQGASLHRASAALAGRSPSKFAFDDSIAATLLGTVAGPTFALDNGYTFIVIGDGTTQTATFAAVAGGHAGGTGASTDMTAELDTKFKIRANGDATWHTITCDWVGGSCDTGAEIAAELQSKIRALGATYGYSSISVAFDTDHYDFTSAQKGTGSTIEIDRAADHDCCDDLDIGPNGTTSVGTGDAVDIAAATLAEVLAKINGSCNKVTAADGTTGIRLTSKTTGHASEVYIEDGTANTALGFAHNDKNYGTLGLGLGWEPGDTNYTICATLEGVSQGSLAAKALTINSKSATGFQVECETAAATDTVGFIILAE